MVTLQHYIRTVRLCPENEGRLVLNHALNGECHRLFTFDAAYRAARRTQPRYCMDALRVLFRDIGS
jgi:hypothetical protein